MPPQHPKKPASATRKYRASAKDRVEAENEVKEALAKGGDVDVLERLGPDDMEGLLEGLEPDDREEIEKILTKKIKPKCIGWRHRCAGKRGEYTQGQLARELASISMEAIEEILAAKYGEQWACERCTMLNDFPKKKCGTCKKNRPETAEEKAKKEEQKRQKKSPTRITAPRSSRNSATKHAT